MTSERFRVWRKGRGYSIRKAAEVLGVSTATIQRWEGGGKVPKLAALACQAISNELKPWE